MHQPARSRTRQLTPPAKLPLFGLPLRGLLLLGLPLRRLLLLGLLLLVVSAVSGCGRSASPGPVTWRFAIEESEGSVQHVYAMKFKELIERRTGGEVEVIVYPYGTLGTSTQMTEQLNMGVLEFAMASPGAIGKFMPELQVFLLHFLLPEDDAIVSEVLGDAGLREEFDRLYAEKGLRLLSIFSEGEMVWTTDREIRAPEDFAGMKFRVMTTPLLLASYDAYGASATPLPYSEVYSGLQLNMLDGQVNPVFAIERQKFYEVCEWMIFSRHAHFVTTVAANREFMQRLPESRRRLVLETVAELDPFIYRMQRRFQYERLKDILADLKARRSEYHISGDLDAFLDSLTAEERRRLVDENESVEWTAGLSDSERERFRQLSRQVRRRFRSLAGERGQRMLERVQARIRAALEAQANSEQTPQQG